MHKSYFDIDGTEYIFEGYTDGTHWNGWATPWFTKEVAEEIMKQHNIDNDRIMQYDEANDRFFVCTTVGEYEEFTFEEEVEEYKGKDFTINGKELHLYPIGAWNWVWDNIADYQSKESKIVWDYILEEYHWIKGKDLHNCYYGINRNINGYMSEKELKIFTDGFIAACERN